MFDCQNSIGEFAGWSRTETDYFCHQLGVVITESGVEGYGVACSRNDWDELVTDNVRTILGDSEGYCIRNCFLKAAEWAQNNSFDPHMNFVFDSFDTRPQRQRDSRIVLDIFQRQVAPPPTIVGMHFLKSEKTLPLQAADLIAWEFYQHAKDVLASGLRPPQRKAWSSLGRSIKFRGQIARREVIERTVDHVLANPHVNEIANHFKTFDPDTSGGQSL